MAHVLLVHGANHGAWCWRDVAPDLTDRGHAVRTVDLPSVSSDPAALTRVTLDDDARTILAALTAKTLLVGHSAAGYAITRAAALAPEKIAALVYLCAYVPRPDASIADLAREAPGHPLDGVLDIDRSRRAYRIRERGLRANLYNDCPDETVAFARPRLGWQATLPHSEAIAAPPPDIPAHTVTCTDDRTIPPAQQDDMARTLAAATRHEIDTGHSPFFAAPAALAALLDRIAQAL